MKRIAFLLAVIMMLTLPLTSIAEDEIIFQDSVVENDDLIIDTDTVPELDDVIIPDDVDLTLDSDLILSEELIDDFSTETTPPSPESSEENASPSKITIGVKETYKFDASQLGSGLTYTSSKPEVATVNKKGVITGKKTGTSTITAKNKKGKTAKITVTVKNAPAKVTLNKTTATIESGRTLQLKAKLPGNTASYKLTWKSSNKKIATVNSKGRVTGKATGTATITVKTFNGKKASCKVTVKKAKPERPVLSADTTNVSINEGGSYTVRITYLNNNTIAWRTGNSNVVTCQWSDGWDGDVTELTIKGLSAGNTTVTVYDTITYDYVIIYVTVTGASPVSSVLFADPTNVSIGVGGSQTVKITYLNNNTIAWKTSDQNVVTCQWVGGWDGDVTELTIQGLSAGNATVTVYDKTTYDSVDIYVTVTGRAQGYTGEILGAWNTDVNTFSNALDDSLVYYKTDDNDDIYVNDYMMVYASSSTHLINALALFNNTSGKYTLSGIHPGMGISTAKNKATEIGWSYYNSKNGNHYYTATYEGETLVLVISETSSSSAVQSVMVFAS